MSHNELTIASILRSLAREYNGLVPEEHVLERVLERRPSTAKNPYATIRERLRWDGLMLGWLRLNRRELVPLHVVLQGLRFRCIPRACDVAAGMLPLVHLHPFASIRDLPALRIEDAVGRVMPLADNVAVRDDEVDEFTLPSFDLQAWYQRCDFAAGDSVLVTVAHADPLTLKIKHEVAADVRQAVVARQDADLLKAIVEAVERAPSSLVPCEEVLLPIYANAPWRTEYPGTPWQQLVADDVRLHLIDDIFITDQSRATAGLFAPGGAFASDHHQPQRQAAEHLLMHDIDALQRDIQVSRQADQEAGLWSGQHQRSSASQSMFDHRSEDELRAEPGFFDALAALGDLDASSGMEWELEIDAWDDADDELDTLLEPDFDVLFGDELNLREANERLNAALPADVVERLHQAQPEEVELLLAAHLNTLLVKVPELFPSIDLIGSDTSDNGGYDPLTGVVFDTLWQDDSDEWDDDEDWESSFDSETETQLNVASDVYTTSNDLINQFQDYLRETGKSANTARYRTRNLLVYAEFLAYYYNRTLAEGDYATLDEYLFYFYPRRVMNSSPRQARETCISLKQFYKFLQQRGDIADDRFAVAHWRRRDQAALVVELYDRIESDSPSFEKLFSRLFEPYT